MTALAAVALCAALAAAVAAQLRFLRVAQREHYLAGTATRFALRWWRCSGTNLALGLIGLGGVVASAVEPAAALATALVAGAGPIGLGLRGRTGRLAWTRRLRTLAATAAVLDAAAVGGGAAAGGLAPAALAAAAVALGAPIVLDLALGLTHPLEEMLAGRHVRRAAGRLERARPLVVAITGSYGKTSTKNYVAHLAGAARSTLPSPASFNNRAGLARTVNEHLGPGVEVLVAEMGTYGPGEIAAMCRWMHPEIAVITAIGPVHLERMRSLDRILAAKSEITEGAGVAVLNVDDKRLAGLADRLAAEGRRVVRASARDTSADVAVLPDGEGVSLWLSGTEVGHRDPEQGAERPAALSNAACAAAVALELGLEPAAVLERLSTLPVVPNRLQGYVAEGGYLVLDDAFNSNPAGARLALERLGREAAAGRRVVVTPGMVELGPLQFEENAALGEAAASVAAEVVVVGRTNRRALRTGAERAASGAEVVPVATLQDALARVRATLGAGDVVLFENDLPDHFP